ncbi:MAG: Uma2 family endonuclease [Saprospiraceae bacterium]|nr:Uma2 family endonuclease [Saprospiraceae bacterium]
MVEAKSATATRPYTAEECFELEKRSEERHEFVYGNLELMPGESLDANRIGQNCEVFFLSLLDGDKYDVFRLSIRHCVIEGKLYRCPDLGVVPTATIRHTHEVKGAELIIEVASEDSYNRDHKTKLKEYTEHFPTLRYYLIVGQNEPSVAVYSRQNANEKWSCETFSHLEDEIPLDCFQARLPLRIIYKKNHFWRSQS